ncbi:MAG: hypothetical protein M3137_08760, partial [Actinomycetota bacterium]|nr:hypothetical protein [Actinomycetota bacterium]
DLITRAICCLRPQVPGLSDNIRVRSVVGRWLEHSRVYYFGAGSEGPGPEQTRTAAPTAAGHYDVPYILPDGGEVYMGSADMMERNLDRRVEAVVAVCEPDLAARLRRILDVELADDALAWELRSDATWHKVPVVSGFNAHRHFQQGAVDRGRQRREPEALHVPAGAAEPGPAPPRS